MTTPSSRRVRGASVVGILVAIAIVVGIAAAAWFLILRPHRQTMLASQRVAQEAKHHPVNNAVAPPVNVAAMTTTELLAEASKAIKDQRLLAPKGNNAFEFYLKVLQRQPNNQVAKDALRETFPFAANAAEQVINQGDFTEAQREIGLLAKAAPDNYTLTILRSKLDARRKVKVQQQQAAQLAVQKQAAAAAAAAAAKAQQAQLAKQKVAQQAARQLAAAKAAAAKPKGAQAPELAKQSEPEPAQPNVVIQDAVLVKKVTPHYPPAAARLRRQGWVEVEYTVGVDGKVHDAHVVAARPHHVFNRVAVRAVSKWVYKPALRNGEPMAVTMRKRIRFTLSGS